MSKWTAIVSVALVCLLGLLSRAADDGGQAAPGESGGPTEGIAVVVTPPAPTTQLETVQRRTDTVLVRGFTDVAGLRSDDAATVRVLAVELTDLKASEKVVGLAIEVRPAARGTQAVLSFVDENEVDGLIAGLDTLAKVEHNATSLTGYEARFRTKGMLELANIDINGSRFITVTTSQVLPATSQLAWATATFPIARARELEQQLSAAKDVLSRTKG